MAYTQLYNKTLIRNAKIKAGLEEKFNKEEMLEIFEAWVTVGLLGLIENIGHAAALQMVKDKMGDPSPPRTKPKLIVDNDPVQAPCDCA